MVENRGYHAHIYYNPETRTVAEASWSSRWRPI